jgi:hypothetical protein
MTAYKLVTIDAPYWGFGYRLEQALILVTPLCFEQFLRYCFHYDFYGEDKCPNFFLVPYPNEMAYISQ